MSLTTDANVAALDALLARAAEEVEHGLPNEQHRLGEALINCDYYRGENERYVPARPAEDYLNYTERQKRTSLLTQRVVDVLTSHLYNPGPGRTFDLPEPVSTWLHGVYESADVNATFAAADRASTLNDVSMIQVAATGDPADPIRLHVWDSSTFAAWAHPDDCTRAAVVCTIDRCDEQTRYTLYSATQILVYETRKLLPGQTSGGRVARLVSSEPNPYGVLPFIAIPFRHQVGEFWTDAIGTPIRKANAAVDVILSDLAESVVKHLNPIGIATNVDENWRPVFRPGGFVILPPSQSIIGMEGQVEPKISYAQPQVPIEATWHDLDMYISHALEMAGVPMSAVRLEQSGTSSGVAIVAEQAPLTGRARQRQPMAGRWERALARLILQVGGSYYGRADLLAASSDPKLSLNWPPIQLPIPGPDADAADQAELAMGLVSLIDVLQRRRNISRDEAIATLQRIAEDRRLAASIGLAPPPAGPGPAPVPAPPDPSVESVPITPWPPSIAQ